MKAPRMREFPAYGALVVAETVTEAFAGREDFALNAHSQTAASAARKGVRSQR